MMLDSITEGDGNCFPRAVVQQCKRQEIQKNIENSIKMKINHFMSVRSAVCDFMLNISHPCIERFRQSYNANEYQVSRISWNDYWFAMRQNKVWVDYKFIQGTAWYLSHDMMIVTTQSTPENPYLYISGNREEMNIPCLGVPLLIGSQLDLHYQSLLPTDHVPERGEFTGLDLNEDNFPPLVSKPMKKEKKKEINKPEHGSNHTNQTRCKMEKQKFQHVDTRNVPPKQKQREFSFCPNCQKEVESVKSHFQTSLICKQTSSQGLTAELPQDENKRRRTTRPVIRSKTFAIEIPKKTVKIATEKKSGQTKCKGCEKEFKSIENHVKKSFHCQNMYDINEKLDETMCSDDDFAPNKARQDGHKRKETKSPADKTSIKEKQSCLACKKCVLNIVLHLRRSKPCQPLYDMEQMEESKKADVKLKKDE